MIKKYLFLVFTLLSVSVFSNNFGIADSAEVAYKKKDYDRAISVYESLAGGNYVSADMYYNLANAYYKQANYPYAILNYEKALKLDPQNEDYLHNLKLANTHVIDKIETVPTPLIYSIFTSVINIFMSNTWAIIALMFFIGAMFCIYRYLFSKSYAGRRMSFILSWPLFILFALTLYFSIVQKNLSQEEYGIVTASYVNIKSEPDESSTDLFILHEGIKVKYEDTEISGWIKIRITDGNKGWIESKDVEKI